MNNYKTKKVMKKLASLLTCICLILSTTACSQSKNYSSGNWGSKKVIASNKYVTKDIKVDNFKKISVAGSPDVTFTQKSGRPEVEVYTSDNIVDLLDIKVKDNTLYIGFKKDVNVSYKKLEVRVSAETLNGISVAGSGDVFLKNGLQTNDNLSINVAGSGDIKGSGIKCNDMKVSVAGSGDINADNITCNNLEKYLDKPKYRPDKQKEMAPKIGIVNGLAWTSVGGTTLEVQAIRMEGKGKLTLTGKLGEVMKESASVAYSYVRSEREKFGLEDKFYEKYDIHLHFPEGAVPKDGPSAGIAITTALISAISHREIRQDIAMTGEITITGEVLPIGGVKEKVIGAHRVGIREVILPFDNGVDVDELPKEVKKDVKIHLVKTYCDVEKIVFKKD